MAKAHKHKDLIIAWAQGALIDSKLPNKEWKLDKNPNWHNAQFKFRIHIKPLVAGKWYPVIYKNKGMVLYCNNAEAPKPLLLISEVPNPSIAFSAEEFSWIGEPLSINWPADPF